MPPALIVLIALVLIYAVGILLKKRFSTKARVYSFAAYEPEEDDTMHPARICSRYRFYGRLFGKGFLPRITSALSFLPFVANRIRIREFVFSATARLGQRNDSVILRTPKGSFRFYRLREPASDYPTDETEVKCQDLIPTAPEKGGFRMKHGDVIVIREGTRYTFLYFFLK